MGRPLLGGRRTARSSGVDSGRLWAQAGPHLAALPVPSLTSNREPPRSAEPQQGLGEGRGPRGFKQACGLGPVSQPAAGGMCGGTRGGAGGVGCYFGRCRGQGSRNMHPTPYKPMWLSSCSDKLFKTGADRQERSAEQACNRSQLSLSRIPIKQMPEAQSREGRLGAGRAPGNPEAPHESSGQALGHTEGRPAPPLTRRRCREGVFQAPGCFPGPSGLAQRAGSAGLSGDTRHVGLLHAPQSQGTSPLLPGKGLGLPQKVRYK